MEARAAPAEINQLYEIANSMTQENAKASLREAYRIVDGAAPENRAYLQLFLETLAMSYQALTGKEPPDR